MSRKEYVFWGIVVAVILLAALHQRTQVYTEHKIAGTTDGVSVSRVDDYTYCSKKVRKKNNQASENMHKGSFDRAKELSLEVLQDEPGCFSAWTNLGTAHYYTNDFTDAHAAYLEAMRVNPDDAGLHAALGTLHSKAHGPAESIDYFTRSIELDDRYAVAHWGIGINYYRLEKYELAHRHLSRFLELDPQSFHASAARTYVEEIDSMVASDS